MKNWNSLDHSVNRMVLHLLHCSQKEWSPSLYQDQGRWAGMDFECREGKMLGVRECYPVTPCSLVFQSTIDVSMLCIELTYLCCHSSSNTSMPLHTVLSSLPFCLLPSTSHSIFLQVSVLRSFSSPAHKGFMSSSSVVRLNLVLFSMYHFSLPIILVYWLVSTFFEDLYL